MPFYYVDGIFYSTVRDMNFNVYPRVIMTFDSEGHVHTMYTTEGLTVKPKNAALYTIPEIEAKRELFDGGGNIGFENEKIATSSRRAGRTR